MNNDYIRICAEIAYNDIIIDTALNDENIFLESIDIKSRIINILKIFKTFVSNLFNKIFSFLISKITQLKNFIKKYKNIYHEGDMYINCDGRNDLWEEYNDKLISKMRNLITDYKNARMKIMYSEYEVSFDKSAELSYEEYCKKIINSMKNRNKEIKSKMNRDNLIKYYKNNVKDKSKNLDSDNKEVDLILIKMADKDLVKFTDDIKKIKEIYDQELISIDNLMKQYKNITYDYYDSKNSKKDIENWTANDKIEHKYFLQLLNDEKEKLKEIANSMIFLAAFVTDRYL